MNWLKNWFEEFVLDIKFVKENIENSYRSVKLDGSKTIDDSKIEEKHKEFFDIVRRVEDLKLLEEKKKREADERLNDYILSKTREADSKAEELAKKMVNDLLSPVDLNSIVTLEKVSSGAIIKIGGVKADDAQLKNLKSEAEAITQFALWKLIQETPKELAERSMFVSGETLADLQKGKSILYTLSTQRNIINVLKSYIPK